jgi:hypothetical protein
MTSVGKGPQGWAHPGLGHLALVVRRVLWSPAVRYTELLWEGEVGPRVTISLLRHLALKLIMSLIVQRDDAACREGSLGLKVARTGREGSKFFLELSKARQSRTSSASLSLHKETLAREGQVLNPPAATSYPVATMVSTRLPRGSPDALCLPQLS